MPQPAFLAVIDDIPAVARQLVVCLGRPATIPEMPAGQADRLLVFDNVDARALGAISRLDPRRMAHGLVVVTTRAEHARDPKALLQAQKLLALLFVKFVEMPAQSTRVPDPLGLRAQEAPPEYLHLLNRWRNTPLHLRHPLVDKLAAENVGLPCLLLLPGPSLAVIQNRLPELARRYLLVTISRALPYLRAQGVEPDVLVQLDTVPMQEHFHHPDERFPNAALLSLSIAPVHNFAPRFRRTFFIDSFDLAVLPNPARLRESWTSSLLACLGALEALGAPQALLCGADLRVLPDGVYYDDGQNAAKAPELPLHHAPLTCKSDVAVLADATGRRAEAPLQFFAAAAEAELFARAIGQERGTAFCNLSPLSLLDPEVFAPMDLEKALAAPELDKTPFLEKIDRAAAKAEQIDLPALRERCGADLAQAEHGRDLFTCLRVADPGALAQHPCHAYVSANVPWFRPTGAEGVARCAGNLADELCAAARFARNVAALYCRAAKGEALPVLVTAEEEAKVLAALAAMQPGWTWRAIGLRTLAGGRAEPSGGAVDLTALDGWLRRQDALLLAPGCAREFRYVLSLLGGSNILPVEDLLAYRPLCEPQAS